MTYIKVSTSSLSGQRAPAKWKMNKIKPTLNLGDVVVESSLQCVCFRRERPVPAPCIEIPLRYLGIHLGHSFDGFTSAGSVPHAGLE